MFDIPRACRRIVAHLEGLGIESNANFLGYNADENMHVRREVRERAGERVSERDKISQVAADGRILPFDGAGGHGGRSEG